MNLVRFGELIDHATGKAEDGGACETALQAAMSKTLSLADPDIPKVWLLHRQEKALGEDEQKI